MKAYNDVKAAPMSTEREKIPVGGYVAQVKSAVIENTPFGDRLVIYFDISEGDFRGFFQKDFDDQQGQEDRKWRGIYRLWLPKDDGSEKDSWSKRSLGNMIWSFESSNPGYHWDWNEATLKGKTIGVLFRNKEWEYNGRTGWSPECSGLIEADRIRSGKYKTPKDKPLNGNRSEPTPIPDDDSDLPWN